MVSRVHTLLPPSYDWSGTDGKPGASEDKRERAEVQRSYYGFLNALAQNQLLQCLHVRPFTAALVSLQATNQCRCRSQSKLSVSGNLPSIVLT